MIRTARRLFVLAAAVTVAACSHSVNGPSPSRRNVTLGIEGLPEANAIKVGQSILLSVESEDEPVAVVWSASAAHVAHLVPTQAISPSRMRSAWLTAAATGATEIEAKVFFADGSYAKVSDAKVCELDSSAGCLFRPAALAVTR